MSQNYSKNIVLCFLLSSCVSDQGRGPLSERPEAFCAQAPQQVAGAFSEAVPWLGSTWTQDMNTNRQRETFPASLLQREGMKGL